jgi:hypothetical protein
VSDITVIMSFSLLLRPTRADSLASRTGWRAQVCPPSLRQAPASPWGRLMCWLLAPGPLHASPPVNRLPGVRQDFMNCLADIDGESVASLTERIAQSRSLRELWHLRTELYRVVALSHSQHEAEQRVARLNHHFPTRAPRSGFIPLAS